MSIVSLSCKLFKRVFILAKALDLAKLKQQNQPKKCLVLP